MAIEVPHGGKRKSMAVALALAFFFGFFGLLYANWKVACGILAAWVVAVIAIISINPNAEIPLAASFAISAVSMAVAWWLVDRHNKAIDAFEQQLDKKRSLQPTAAPLNPEDSSKTETDPKGE